MVIGRKGGPRTRQSTVCALAKEISKMFLLGELNCCRNLLLRIVSSNPRVNRMSRWISSRAVVMRVNGRLCKNNKLQGCLFFNYFPHYFFPFVKFGTVFDTTLVFTPFRALHVKVIENSGHWLLTGKYLNSLI